MRKFAAIIVTVLILTMCASAFAGSNSTPEPGERITIVVIGPDGEEYEIIAIVPEEPFCQDVYPQIDVIETEPIEINIVPV